MFRMVVCVRPSPALAQTAAKSGRRSAVSSKALLPSLGSSNYDLPVKYLPSCGEFVGLLPVSRKVGNG
jgi:hypothetical protein